MRPFFPILVSLSSDVFLATHVDRKGLFALLNPDFNFWANRLYKGKDSSQYQFGTVKEI